MSHRYNVSSIQANFIKELLRNSFIPIYKSVVDGDILYEGIRYVYGTSAIKCTKSGILQSKDNPAKYVILSTNVNENTHHLKFSENFISYTNYYDYKLHEKLGNYLRFYKTSKGINLLPFYNCYSGRISNSICISESLTDVEEKSLNNEKFKTYLVPIKFDRDYTIAIDSFEKVIIYPIFYRNNTLLSEVNLGTANDKKNDIVKDLLSANPVLSLDGSAFNTPVKYLVKIDDVAQGNETLKKIFLQLERHLFMCIQVYKDNDSTLTVLEGDFRNHKAIKTVNSEVSDNINPAVLSTMLATNLELLSLNNKISYAFSDRLIEYLLENVIDLNDELGNNVEWVQQKTGLKLVDGIWCNEVQISSYNDMIYSNREYKDLNGFIDKDIEKIYLGL